MHHQHRFPIQSHGQGIGQKQGAAHAAELRCQQEITIAVHDEARHSIGGERAKSRDCSGLRRVCGIVANPSFEQVAENIQGVRVLGLSREKTQKLLDDRRAARIDVQI
jgi:hypothetical protein